ncbi:MAG TPA: hypothetical protein VHS33_08140 [Sphingomicrobium sp.]|jgi:energy-coupling factor transporter ATP-binding protein EcfA2|nr:hypothetical protein [Sphingomicrobium sp.]
MNIGTPSRLDQVEFNAKSLSPSQVASTFIPPLAAFQRLVNKNNSVVIGPRGSGKTTLFKMLMRRALPNWDHEAASQFLNRVKFHSVFIPADRTWGAQLTSNEQLSPPPDYKVGEAAFSAHTLIALVVAMRDSKEVSDLPAEVEDLRVELNNDCEALLAREIAQALSIKLSFPSLLGVEIALRQTLLEMDPRRVVGGYPQWANVESLPNAISLVISLFEGIAKPLVNHWVFLFDEIEIAPERIKSFLLDALRGFDQRVTFKLALVPFLKDVRSLGRDYRSAQSGNDFDVIALSYPNKDDALEFSTALFESLLVRGGLAAERPEKMFGTSMFSQGRLRLSSSFRKTSQNDLPETYESLAAKDPSFAAYLEKRGLDRVTRDLSENQRASDIRKVVQLVLLRDFHIRPGNDPRRVLPGQLVWRSRKSLELYAGYPSILELAEGNPRTLLSLVVPLISDLAFRRESNAKLYIGFSQQGEAINRAVQTLVALVKTLPPSWSRRDNPRGLLEFIDAIGRGFERRLLRDDFDPDYVGTFIVDADAGNMIVSAVGDALNAGALVFVPEEGSSPDATLTDLRNKRFRLSYTLAPRYRLPLILGRSIQLSSLLEARTSLKQGGLRFT